VEPAVAVEEDTPRSDHDRRSGNVGAVRIPVERVRERGQFGEDDVAGQRLTRIPGFMDLKGTP